MSVQAQQAQQEPKVPLYTGWRPNTSVGLFGLTTIQSLVMLAAIGVVVVVELTAGVLKAAVLGALLALTVVIVSKRDKHGLCILDRIEERARFQVEKRRRRNVFRGGALSVAKRSSGKLEPPGYLGRLRLVDAQDAWRRPFTMVRHPGGQLTVVMALAPSGAGLVDQEEINKKVALWGEHIKDVAKETGVVATTLTVESSPDPGSRLRREVLSRRSPSSPDLAQRVMDQVVDGAAGMGIKVSTWLTMTFDPRAMAGGRGSKNEKRAIRDLETRLPGLYNQITETTSSAVHLMTGSEVIRMVREAYDPASAVVFEQAADRGEVVDLGWGDAGPVSHNAQREYFVHDSGLSCVWVVSRPPQGYVQSNVLERVLTPSRDVERKRFTAIYTPLDVAKAPDVVERDVDKTQNAVKLEGQRPKQRTQNRASQALKTAQQEARGAAVVDFSFIITATVSAGPDEFERLAVAKAAMESSSASSHLLEREAFGAMDSAFVMGLPLGMLPDQQKLNVRL